MTNTIKRSCSHCGGSGEEIDPRATGAKLRGMREKAGKSLRFVADKMGISPPYLSDLERGNRAFSDAHIAQFEAALKS